MHYSAGKLHHLHISAVPAMPEYAFADNRAEMADLAISMASKLVEKNVDATTNKKLIDDFLSEAGDTQ